MSQWAIRRASINDFGDSLSQIGQPSNAARFLRKEIRLSGTNAEEFGSNLGSADWMIRAWALISLGMTLQPSNGTAGAA